MTNPKQTREIKIHVSTQGMPELKALKRELADLNKRMADTSTVLKKLDTVFSAIFGASVLGVGITTLTQWSDTMQKLTDRMRLFSAPGEDALDTMQRLADVSKQTKVSIEDTASVFTRVRVATEEMGLSTSETLKFTQALQQSFRISGATAEEAAASTIQLTQALAAGRLQGQELRSVTLQNAIAGRLLAKEFDTTRAGLKKLGEEGKLVSDRVLKAFIENFDELNAQAGGLKTTFGEGATLALNDFKVALNKLNADLDISGKFNAGLKLAIENSKALVTVLAFLAGTTIPALALAVKAASTSIATAIGLTPGVNLIALGMGALAAAITAVVLNWDKFSDAAITATLKAEYYFQRFAAKVISFAELLSKPFGGSDALTKIKDEWKAAADASEAYLGKLENSQKSQSLAELKMYDEVNTKAKEKRKEAKTLEEQIGELQAKFNRGKISVESFNAQITKLEKSLLGEKTFVKGTMTLEKYNEELDKLQTNNTQRLFENGRLSAEKFNEAIKANKLKELDKDFRTLKISAEEYHKKLIEMSDEFRPGSALYTGAADYIKSVGTLSSSIANMIAGTFKNLEDAIVNAAKTGKFEFSKMTEAILDDLTRIAVQRAITLPLAQGFQNLLPTATTATPTPTPTVNAMGAAYNRGVQFFASGGVVDRTTAFGMASGRMGIMGEAGPEGIFPLKRNSKGELGVEASGNSGSTNVTVNVINQSGSEVEQREQVNADGTRTLDIIITGKIKDAFANGSLDRTMSSVYGLRRRGA